MKQLVAVEALTNVAKHAHANVGELISAPTSGVLTLCGAERTNRV